MADIKADKCPACGALRDSFSAVCPDCGYEFKDQGVSNSLSTLAEKLEEFDRMLAEAEGKIPTTEFDSKKAEQIKAQGIQGIEKLKANTITNFPIPNSRNDLMEFAVFIENHIQPVSYFAAITKTGKKAQFWNKIWIEKGEQIAKKAAIALQGDTESLNKINRYVSNAKAVSAQNDKNRTIAWSVIAGGIVLIIVLSQICK